MSRRKKGRAISGWLALDKPTGITSTRALAIVKRLFDAEKAGHAGTLDPLASGVLPIAFGEATKTVPFMMDGRKRYRFTVRWGAETSTDDCEGEVVATAPLRPDRAAIEAMLPRFTGIISQVPPRFSAVLVEGQRAYDLAREGEEVTLEARPAEVMSLGILAMPSADETVFEAECGKGTYVRALARDLGRALGTFGHVTELRRLAVGCFAEGDAIGLEALRERAEQGPAALDAALAGAEVALTALPEIAVNAGEAARLARGQSILLRRGDPLAPGIAYAMSAGRLVALGDVAAGEFQPRRIFR